VVVLGARKWHRYGRFIAVFPLWQCLSGGQYLGHDELDMLCYPGYIEYGHSATATGRNTAKLGYAAGPGGRRFSDDRPVFKKMSYLRKGTGDYENSGDWTWEHFPPPFTFLGPPNPASQPSPLLGGGRLGYASGACGCGCSSDQGLGQTGLFGSGLFQSVDPTTWGIGEYAAIGLGVYLVASVLGDSSRGAHRVRNTYRRYTR